MKYKNIFFFILIFSLLITLTSLNALEENNVTIEKSINKKDLKIEKNYTTTEKVKTSQKTIALNSTNFNNYVTDKQFNENVSDGDTIDIQGKLDGSKFSLDITKPVNIISSNNAYINFHTGEFLEYGESERGMLRILPEGAGTNITGITLHNTRLSLENTRNVIINNISCLDENVAIGQNVGAVTIREGSENITITNSYFKTVDNGGHSNVVFAVAYNCLFENNTVEGYINTGLIGNLLYLTTYNVNTTNITPHNVNITIRNNIIKSYNIPEGVMTCWGLVLEGYGHIIENNIINHSIIAVTGQYSDAEYGTNTELGNMIFRNNTIYHGTTSLAFPGIVENNTFYDTVGVSRANCSNNSFTTVNIGNNIYFHENIVNNLKINGDNNTINNNTIYSGEEYAVTVIGENNVLSNNSIGSVNGRGELAINNTTSYTNINNNNPAIFMITKENKESYLEEILLPRIGLLKGYTLKENKFINNDTLIFNITLTDLKNNFINDTNHYYENITLNLMNSNGIYFKVNNSRIINCTSITTDGNIEAYDSYIIKCGNVIYSENSYIYNKGICPKDNQVLFENKNIGTLENENIQQDQEVIMIRHGNIPLNITIPVNITGKYQEVKQYSFTNNVTFNEGSQNTNLTNCYFGGSTILRTLKINTDEITFNNCLFNETVIINANNIKFINCTFYQQMTLNDTTSINITNCTFNTTITPIQVYNSARITIDNNLINTIANNTIIFDEDSDKSTNLVKNNQLITQEYLGNDNVITQSRIKLENNTPKYPTEIQVEYQETMFKDEQVTINVSVTNTFNDSLVNNGFIEAYIDGIFFTNNTLTNGITSFNFSYSENNKILPLRIWYYDTNNKYEDNNTKLNINFTKTNVTIETEDFTAKLNENATIIAKFTDERNKPITEGNVTIQISNLKYQTTINNGTATITEKVTEEWLDKNTFKISITETDYNKQTQTTLPLNTQKGDVTITNTPIKQSNNNINFNISLKNILDENINEGTITIKDTNNNNILLEQDITGNDISINITPTEDNLINIEYTGEDYYSDTTQTINITIPPTETITTITIPPTAITNTPVELKATVNDIDGNPLNTGTITFTKDNETIATTQVTDGTATATAIFKTEEDTTITATYTPTSTEYATSTAEASISIQKPQTILNIEDVTLTAGETVTITATLTDQLGNNINGGKVVFKVNGKTVKDANGKVVYAKVADGIATAEYTVPLDYSGKEVNITATYSGTSTYNKETTTITTTVATPQPTLTVTPITEDIQTGSTITLKAKIAAGDKAITSGKIVFKINGKTVKDENGKVIYAKVDSNGEVSVDYVLPASYKAGNYTIEAVFTGVGYDKLTGNTTMNVVKA